MITGLSNSLKQMGHSESVSMVACERKRTQHVWRSVTYVCTGVLPHYWGSVSMVACEREDGSGMRVYALAEGKLL